MFATMYNFRPIASSFFKFLYSIGFDVFYTSSVKKKCLKYEKF